MSSLPTSEASKTNAELDEWRIGHIMVWRFYIDGQQLRFDSKQRRTVRDLYDDCELLNSLSADYARMGREYYDLLNRLRRSQKIARFGSDERLYELEREFDAIVSPGLPVYSVSSEYGGLFVADDKGQRFLYFEGVPILAATGEPDYVTMNRLARLRAVLTEVMDQWEKIIFSKPQH